MNYEKFGAAVTMSMEQIGEAVNSHIEDFDINKVTDMIAEIIDIQSEEEKQKIKAAPPIVKLTYIAREMYSMGFMYGLYMYNEALKEQFEDMQARKKEREYKRQITEREVRLNASKKMQHRRSGTAARSGQNEATSYCHTRQPARARSY